MMMRATLALLISHAALAAEPARLCTPQIFGSVIVASPAQRDVAGRRAEPPLVDTFDWPDTPLGVVRSDAGVDEFFASDGGFRPRQVFHGHEAGNNKNGSITATVGTLDDPLGTAQAHDVSISPNPDRSVNPNFTSYTYMGGGPVYRVPAGRPGAGHLLATYHAELPSGFALPGARLGGLRR